MDPAFGKRGDVDTELSYLTHGISWEASYVGVVSEADDAMDFAGWVQIKNQSGASYENALLKLVAGDVQIEKDRRLQRPETMYTLDAAAGKRDGFEEKSFYEYHLYTLPRRVSIADKQNKQITLIPSLNTSVNKEYTYNHRKDAKRWMLRWNSVTMKSTIWESLCRMEKFDSIRRTPMAA